MPPYEYKPPKLRIVVGGSGLRLVVDGRPPVLTTREQEILRMVCWGLSNSQIGRVLHISEDTVKTHMRRMMHRLGATNRAHAVGLGFGYGILGLVDTVPVYDTEEEE